MKIRLSPLALFLAGVVLFSPAVAGAGEIVTGLGAGGGPVVSAFDAATLSQLSSFFAYSPGFTGGVRVAVGDVNGDSVPDILTGTGPGGPAHVKVFDAVSGAEVRSFFAYAPAFGGGVRVAAGDISGDGTADIITGAGPAGATHIKVFDGVTNAEIRSFFAYSPSFTGGVFVGSGDVNNDGRDDIVTGADAGGGPHVKVFDGVTGAEIRSFFAGSPSFTGGIRVAAGDVNATASPTSLPVPGQAVQRRQRSMTERAERFSVRSSPPKVSQVASMLRQPRLHRPTRRRLLSAFRHQFQSTRQVPTVRLSLLKRRRPIQMMRPVR